MKPLFDINLLATFKSNQQFPFKCEHCGEIFYLTKHKVRQALNPNERYKAQFCGRKCAQSAREKKYKIICDNCGKVINKIPAEVQKKHNFCSRSCAATYNNTHKTSGTRRSKLEEYFEQQLTVQYPALEIHFNRKDTINSELDIYIPSLSLAFELNGIFHYEPIYGAEKLKKIQSNDQRKFQACLEKGIELCIIDTSTIQYFKKERTDKILQIITKIINAKL